MPDPWLAVWASLSDENLEQWLRRYCWLATAAPNIYQPRLAQLIAEAERRGKPELVESAKDWVASHEVPPAI